MSEYMEKHAVSKIIGSPPGYVGYDEAGQLTEKIRRHPYSVVLFDEIEKAHPDVMNILLQVLDDGKITDSHGKTVDFSNTVLVMTTNAGSQTGNGYAGFGNGGSQTENKTEKALSDFLRPEFINRIDEIITFRPLEEKDFIEISRIMINDLAKALAEKDITVKCSEEALGLYREEGVLQKVRREKSPPPHRDRRRGQNRRRDNIELPEKAHRRRHRREGRRADLRFHLICGRRGMTGQFEQLEHRFSTDRGSGLGRADIKKIRREYGANDIYPTPSSGFFGYRSHIFIDFASTLLFCRRGDSRGDIRAAGRVGDYNRSAHHKSHRVGLHLRQGAEGARGNGGVLAADRESHTRRES